MISSNSSLRHLPTYLESRQALVIDGLRHAAEIANLSYRRLQQTLTQIVKMPGENETLLYTAAFLDAWAFVDAIDRFRSLWMLLPKEMGKPDEDVDQSFARQTQVIRNLRNVADHLSTRIDYVVSRESTALGILQWVTLTQPEKFEAVLCILVPGGAKKRTISHIIPEAGETIEGPSGFIRLSAGEYEANLSAVMPQLQMRVRELEEEMSQHLQTLKSGDSPGADVLVKMTLHIKPT